MSELDDLRWRLGLTGPDWETEEQRLFPFTDLTAKERDQVTEALQRAVDLAALRFAALDSLRKRRESH